MVEVTGFSIDVIVTGEGTMVVFGYRIPVPMPPVPQGVMVPKQIAYKHALHLFIPKEKWVGQFGMWEEYHLSVDDSGKIELKKKLA